MGWENANTKDVYASDCLTFILNGSDIDRCEAGINDSFPNLGNVHVFRAGNDTYLFSFQTYIDMLNIRELLQLSLEAINTERTR